MTREAVNFKNRVSPEIKSLRNDLIKLTHSDLNSNSNLPAKNKKELEDLSRIVNNLYTEIEKNTVWATGQTITVSKLNPQTGLSISLKISEPSPEKMLKAIHAFYFAGTEETKPTEEQEKLTKEYFTSDEFDKYEKQEKSFLVAATKYKINFSRGNLSTLSNQNLTAVSDLLRKVTEQINAKGDSLVGSKIIFYIDFNQDGMESIFAKIIKYTPEQNDELSSLHKLRMKLFSIPVIENNNDNDIIISVELPASYKPL